jgi:DUF1680 family protein
MAARIITIVLLGAAIARGAAAELKDVRLLDGPFKAAMQRDAKYLIELEPDRLLSKIREGAKLEPKAAVYGGWESKGVSGHMLGHYLSACSLMWASTDDTRFRDRVNYIIDELALCQAQRPDGYIGGIADQDRIWGEIRAGKITSKGFDLNGGWVPWYVVHKIMAGLIDAHRYCENDKAKAVAIKFADWANDVTAKLNDAQWQKMLACEHGGMNEALANVYAISGDEKHLALAKKFYHRAVLDPLSRGERKLEGLHANTQIPKIIGAERIFQLTGEKQFHAIATTFWDEVVNHHTYAMGGHGLGEHFGSRDRLNERLDTANNEVCGAYNMLKLTKQLFAAEPDIKFADYYERTIFNHILASQDPRTGMMAYFMPLKPGHFIAYSTPDDSFWCCVGTGIENHAKYGDGIYFHGGDQLWVNQFIASELNWREKKITLRMETKFPESEDVKITVHALAPTKAAVLLRIPSWATGATVRANGQSIQAEIKRGKYATIDRSWADGDTIEMTLPMRLRLEPMPDNQNRAAILYGPIVLAGEMGAEGIAPPMPYAKEPNDYLRLPDPPAPVLVCDDDLSGFIEPVKDQALTFRTKGVGRPGDVTLIPLYRASHGRYTVYFDTFTTQQWTAQEKKLDAEQERLRAIAVRTIDVFEPGEMQPERDHNLKGERTQAGEFQGKKWRDANGGWFSFEMKVDPDRATDLVMTYWGSDVGARTFDVLVDDKQLVTQTLNNNKPGEVFDVVHPLPAEMTRGKKTIVVKLAAHPDNTAGGLFGCRTLRRQP